MNVNVYNEKEVRGKSTNNLVYSDCGSDKCSCFPRDGPLCYD